VTTATAVAAVRVSSGANVLATDFFGATALFKERRGGGSFWVWSRLSDRHSDSFEHQKGNEEERKALEMHFEDFCGDKW
jgi:hypothetical protein